MADEENQIVIVLTGADPLDVEELEEAGRSLRDGLREIESLDVSAGPAEAPPPGTRSGVADTLVTLVCTLYVYKTAKIHRIVTKDFKDNVIPRMSRIFRDWLDRNKGKSVIVKHHDGTEYELKNYSEEGIKAILESLGRDDDSHVG